MLKIISTIRLSGTISCTSNSISCFVIITLFNLTFLFGDFWHFHNLEAPAERTCPGLSAGHREAACPSLSPLGPASPPVCACGPTSPPTSDSETPSPETAHVAPLEGLEIHLIPPGREVSRTSAQTLDETPGGAWRLRLGSGQDRKSGGLVTSWDRASMWVPLPHL